MKAARCNLSRLSLAAAAALASANVHAFNSGSTGADGAFNPSSNVTLQVPPSGVFNYTTINIPNGVTVTFTKNASNTPVVMLASGDVTIAGTINVSGSSSANSNLSGTDGLAGAGGVGGYDGGNGGLSVGSRRGGNGLGPGGGHPGSAIYYSGSTTWGSSGSGGGHASSGGAGASHYNQPPNAPGGASYGSVYLQPLVGGSGGGGGGASTAIRGTGGGGGGGAILIAASGYIDIPSTGRIYAYGGSAGSFTNNFSQAGCGGGGSGGAIRLVATVVKGSGQLLATGGSGSCGGLIYTNSVYLFGGAGSTGRIRIEGEHIPYASASTSPAASMDVPGPVFIAGQPGLTITSVAGVAAPAAPTGSMDVTLPAGTSNPVTVVFTTTGVPVGSTINLSVVPTFAAPITATSGATTGTTASATASASVTIPTGHSVFQATVSYTLVASVGDAMSRFANNERVEKVTLVATFGGSTRARLTTVSGKEYDAPAEALAIAAAGR